MSGARLRRLAPRTLAGKLVATVAMVTVSATVAGMGAFALFTDTQTVSQAASSGTVTLASISANGANNRLSVAASNIAAGDTIQRAVDLNIAGTIDLASVALTTTATATSLLDTDATNHLTMAIDVCDVPWTEANSPKYTYTCSGTTSSVLASGHVIVTAAALTNLALTTGSHNYARVTLTLPSGAGNSLAGKSSTIQYSFTATQRTATNQ